MLNKWPVAGLLAGIVIFFWGGLTHMAFNIESYIQILPNEAAITAVLQENLKSPGVYVFPGEMDPAKYEERTKTSPRGMLTYFPTGTPFSFGQSLAVQAGIDVIYGLLAAFLFSMAAPALAATGRRLLFTTLLGVVGVVAIHLPYVNWYGFPAVSILTNLLDQGVASFLAGLVFIKLLK